MQLTAPSCCRYLGAEFCPHQFHLAVGPGPAAYNVADLPRSISMPSAPGTSEWDAQYACPRKGTAPRPALGRCYLSLHLSPGCVCCPSLLLSCSLHGHQPQLVAQHAAALRPLCHKLLTTQRRAWFVYGQPEHLRQALRFLTDEQPARLLLDEERHPREPESFLHIPSAREGELWKGLPGARNCGPLQGV